MKDKRNHHGTVCKSSLEQHFCKCAAITFIAGVKFLESYSATVSYGRLADEIQVNFEIFKVGCRSKYSTYRFVQPRYSIITALLIQPVFSGKAYCKVDF